MALEKTRGIVLHQIKYGETSIIAYLYTDKFGRQAFIVNGARSRKAALKASMFQPLLVHNLEIYYNQKRDLQRIKELRNLTPFKSIPFDIIKNTISLFLAEVLYRCLREQETNVQLFDYLFKSIDLLDNIEEGAANYHLFFLINLTRYLGFYPSHNLILNANWFDLKEGQFTTVRPMHSHHIDPGKIDIFKTLLTTSMVDASAYSINNTERNYLLDKIIEFYQLHLGKFGDIKSSEILKSVFSA